MCLGGRAVGAGQLREDMTLDTDTVSSRTIDVETWSVIRDMQGSEVLPPPPGS